MTNVATTVRVSEYPVRFKAENSELFGVLSAPDRFSARAIGVVLTTGGAYIAATNRNRLSVSLARRLAGQGFHVLRFDYHGIGESGDIIEGYRLDRPFTEDLAGAVQWLRGIGLRRFVLIGSCFGARTILSTADRVDGLLGAVLASTPLRDFRLGDNVPARHASEKSLWTLIRLAVRPRVWRSLLTPQTREGFLRNRHLYVRTAVLKAKLIRERLLGAAAGSKRGDYDWISQNFALPFQRLIDRGVPLLLLYGAEEEFYGEFTAAREGPLGEVLARAGDRVEVREIDGVLHGFTTLRVQDALLAHTERWMERF